MPYNLTTNGIKLCRACCIEKPLSEFPIKRRPDGSPSYGRCKLCTLKYDHERRRKKGQKTRILKTHEKKPLVCAPVSLRDRARIYQMKKRFSLRRIHDKICKECSTLFKGHKASVYCNPRCAKKATNRVSRSKRKALERSVRAEAVNPLIVFERCEWHCQRCGTHTPSHLRGQHKPNSPELDHIVPLSKGGEHSYANTQLLCRKCNAFKTDKLTTELCLVT